MVKDLILPTPDASTTVVRLDHLSANQRTELPAAMSAFLDAAGTSTARGTFYNSAEEQEAAVAGVHSRLFELDRSVYAASLLLDGVTDYTRQLGVVRLLARPRDGEALLTADQEASAVRSLFRSLPPTRMLKLFRRLRDAKVNNARSRRLVLSTVLLAKELPSWAVKYRRKVATALTHAWGRRTASIIAAILGKPAEERTDKENKILQRNLLRFIDDGRDTEPIEQSVRFVLGHEEGLTLPCFVAYREAKSDLSHGRRLPYEVLEGIRSRYHKDVTSAEILELTKAQLTAGQKMALQRKAANADVEVTFDPAAYDPVRLYLYAFEMGMTEAIRDQLRAKAQSLADGLPARFGHVGILLDTSASMMGHATQKRRPISAALALRDVLAEAADCATILTSDFQDVSACQLVDPVGDTSLAPALVSLLQKGADIVFVLSDGYENAPAGQFAQVVRAVRNMGIETPILQFSSVFAAETQGVRSLSPDVKGLPISNPSALGLAMLKTLLEFDVQRAVAALLQMVQPRLQVAPRSRRIEGQQNG